MLTKDASPAAAPAAAREQQPLPERGPAVVIDARAAELRARVFLEDRDLGTQLDPDLVYVKEEEGEGEDGGGGGD